MTIHVLGFILGLLSALFFAFYMVPQKYLRMDNTTFLWGMSIGVLICSCIPFAAKGFPHAATPTQIGLSLVCGIVWCLGTLSFAAGIQHIGLAQATPIKNTTGVIGALVGLIALGEWRTTDPILCLIGSLLIVAAAILIGTTTAHADAPRSHPARGVLFALVAATCYASYLYPLKRVVAAIGYEEFAPLMAVGIVLMATVAVLARPGGWQDFRRYRFRDFALATLGGASWTIALICLILSMQMVDLAIAWSLAQLNTVPAVFLGIVAFREVSFRANWVKISIGLLAATVGTIVLGLAKGR